jgi:predicted F0F1-ATPase subunit
MKKKDEENFWASMWREALLATTLGWDLAIPIFGGVLIGYFLDQWLDTGHIFTLGLLSAGIFAGYYNLWRTIRRLDRKSDLEKSRTGEEGEEEKEKEKKEG